MATSDFLAFAGGSGANVSSQTDYAALPAIATGYSSGIAKSAQLNKTFRQTSIMAAVLAQFIADQTGVNSVDDGTTATLLGNLKVATAGRYLGSKIFTSSGTYTPGVYGGVTATKARFHGVAAGGGSGGCIATGTGQVAGSGAGSAGNPFEFWVISGLASMSITVGAIGSAGSAGANDGGTGGDIVIGSIATIKGGKGGKAGNATSTFPSLFNPCFKNDPSTIATAGGMTLAGILNGVGQTGVRGIALAVSTLLYSAGGNSAYGSGGTTDGATATGFGSGGGGNGIGQSTAATAGFTGAPGIIIVDEFA